MKRRRATVSGANQIVATILAVALGFVLAGSRFGDALARISFDLPFVVRAKIAAPEVVLVYLDEGTAAALGQPLDAKLDRSWHTRLLDRMTREGARAVIYDIVFDAPSADPEIDEQFAKAMRRHGTVVLSAKLDVERQFDVASQPVLAPTQTLREAAAGWGLAEFEPDPDYGVRRVFPGTEDFQSTAAVLAKLLSRDRPSPRARWLNFYGPPGWLRGVSFAQALQPDCLPGDFFRDRIVVVGGRFSISTHALRQDEFAGPWSRWGGRFFPGPEVHATAVLNLLRGDWLERLPTWLEVGFLLLAAVFAGCILNRCAPVRATLAGAAGIVVLGVAATCGAWFARLWWAWLIPAAVQIPFGIVWSVGTQYFAEARRKETLRRAFSLYLSPHMADKIAASEFDLSPGGQLVEATIMFTDLEGFTTLSEELNDPAALSAILIQYFRRTTACILESDGTIIKYMGDAVEAVWNAPLADADHAFKAVLAAYRLREVAKFTANGRIIRTRVGINTGPGFAGNLGSEFRFDYAVIGDTTNFAARLESLNKHFGTDILISDATFAQLGGKFVTRPLGQFRVAGKKHPVGIHELIAPVGSKPTDLGWLEVFAKGLHAFESGDIAMAKRCMEKTREMHGGGDGPAEFFLRTVRDLEREGMPREWTGVIEFTKK